MLVTSRFSLNAYIYLLEYKFSYFDNIISFGVDHIQKNHQFWWFFFQIAFSLLLQASGCAPNFSVNWALSIHYFLNAKSNFSFLAFYFILVFA